MMSQYHRAWLVTRDRTTAAARMTAVMASSAHPTQG